MKIRMKTLAAGPSGVMNPGVEYPVSQADGEALVSGGYAVEVKDLPVKETPKAKDEKIVESAEAHPAPEQAVAPGRSRRR